MYKTDLNFVPNDHLNQKNQLPDEEWVLSLWYTDLASKVPRQLEPVVVPSILYLSKEKVQKNHKITSRNFAQTKNIFPK